MLLISPPAKILLARGATDMRKSFTGLITLTEAVLRQDPASGHLFVFINRRRDMIKILYWDGTGFCIWYKRLARGGFQIPRIDSQSRSASVELSASQLGLILEGIDLDSVRQRLRYRPSPLAESDVRELSPT
jgi:transposase